MPGGRPTKFKPEMVDQARKLAELGATDREAAEFFEVAEDTLYLWKHSHPKFSEALKVGKQTADERVTQSLYRRAIGYKHDAVKIQAVDGVIVETPYVEHFAPDTTAAIFWLKNRRPAEWRDRRELDHTSSDGSMATSPEKAEERLIELMRLAQERAKGATSQEG
jgi:hypothetical protein